MVAAAVPSLRSVAAARFPAGEFARYDGVPVLIEHQGTTQDGQAFVMRRPELEQIAAACNERIRRGESYAMLTLGHTPSPQAAQAGAAQPEVVGYAGPFWVEQINLGEKRCYAICCDWHVFQEDVAKVKKNPRRSPELWLTADPANRFMDPIALLGATPPRLDMGLVYSAAGSTLYVDRFHGAVVEKYAAAGPSATSTFIPEDYAMPEPNDELINAFVTALDGLDWVQWVKNKMAAESNGPASTPPVDPAGSPAAAPAPAATPAPTATPPVGADADAGPEPDNKEKMGMHTELAKYSLALAAQGAELVKLKNQVAIETARRVNSERRQALAERLQSIELDLAEETERCQYSKMSDEQFKNHLHLIDTKYSRLPMGASLDQVLAFSQAAPFGGAPEQYSLQDAGKRAKASMRALEICEQAAVRGTPLDYGSVLEECLAGKR